MIYDSLENKTRLLTTSEAAEYLCIRPNTLAIWLCTNRYPGLKSLKIGRNRRFRLEDLDEFLKTREEITTEEITTTDIKE